MLAAASPKESQELDLFILALALIGRGDPGVPAELREYLRQVIHQAKELAIDPARVRGSIMPEAIRIALQMRKEEAFSRQIEGVREEGVVTADDANRLRVAVEEAFVH